MNRSARSGSSRSGRSSDELAGAISLYRAGDLQRAGRQCERILKRTPGHGDALNLLAIIHLQSGAAGAALPLLKRAVDRYPQRAAYRATLSMALNQLSRFDESVCEARRALEISPDLIEARNNLAVALEGLDRLEEAAVELEQVVASLPEPGMSAINLSHIYIHSGQLERAEELLRSILARDPVNAEAHFNLSSILLRRGDWQEGWTAHAWRWRTGRFLPAVRHQAVPLWQGQPMSKGRVLVWAEQGFGDAIQFMRFLPQIAEQIGELLFECRPELVGLARGVAGIDRVIERTTPPAEIACDAQIALMDLPGVLRTTHASLPSPPYLSLPRCHPPLPAPADENRFRIGLVWAGSGDHANDRRRSMPFEALQPLLDQPDIALYSLQLGKAANQAAVAIKEGDVTDLSQLIRDFSDTAGLLLQLDYLVTVDTAVAHLAGALSLPGGVLLALDGDWRWYPDGERSLWYPSLDQYRQQREGDWQGVVSELAERLLPRRNELIDARQRRAGR